MEKVSVTVRSNVFNNIQRYVKNEKKLESMFISHKYTGLFRYRELIFHPSFAFEVRAILQNIVESRNSYNVNKRELKETIKYITDHTYLSKIENDAELDISPIIKVMKYEPLEPHKKVFKDYARLVVKGGFLGLLLDAVVGSGKTYMSLALSVVSGNDKVIIICPKEAVVDVWVESITNELFRRNRNAWYSTSGEEYKGQQYLICHYEYLTKFIPIAKKLKNVFLIVDEVQFFASQKSQRTQNLNELYEKVDIDKSILMSGTPVMGKVGEVVSLLRFIDPTLAVRAYYKRFLKFYSSPNRFFVSVLRDRFVGSIARITGDMIEKVDIQHIKLSVKLDDNDKYLLTTIQKNVEDYVKDRIKFFDEHKQTYVDSYLKYIGILKDKAIGNGVSQKDFKLYEEDVKTIVILYKKNKLIDIPEIIMRVNSFEKVLLRYLDGEDKKNFREAKTVYKYLALKIQGEVLSLVIGKAREEAHVDIAAILDVESLVSDSDSKTVIFSKYIAVCETITTKLGKKYNVAKGYGPHTKNIPATLNSFLHDPKVNPIVATYKSLSTGVRLTKASSMLLVDLPYTAAELEQAIARVWRLGQDHPVTIYYVALDTGDEPNINSRNIDIARISSTVVETLTGVRLGSIESPKEDDDNKPDILDTKFTSELKLDSTGAVVGFFDYN